MKKYVKSGLKCLHCNKPLRKYRSSIDWDNRTLHKKCYEDRKRFLDCNRILKFDNVIRLY